jgi:cyclopropane fatty-acyl-phospholipid synthase-like methyltransferase/methyltransferase-like protein
MSDVHISYDDVIYPGYAFSFTNPAHLCAAGKLRGLNPPDPRTANILEIGCSTGGNIINIAYTLPQAHCIGIDYSATQIKLGQKTLRDSGLQNITLHTLDARDLHAAFPDKRFDYIIVHGVYSWVDTDVQQSILAACRDMLTKDGLAFISFNAYPGWKLYEASRSFMKFRTAGINNPAQKAIAARQAVNFLYKHSFAAPLHYRQSIEKNAQVLAAAPDTMILHDYLEAVSKPCSFTEFCTSLKKFNLSYVDDARPDFLRPEQCSQEIAQSLSGMEYNRALQYLDYFTGRQFHSAIICHQGQSLLHERNPQHINTLYFSSRIRAQISPEQLISSKASRFFFDNRSIQVDNTFVKAMLCVLASTWPACISYADLISRSSDMLLNFGGTAPDAGTAHDIAQNVLWTLISQNLCSYMACALPAAQNPGEFPISSAVARAQLKQGDMICTLLHHNAKLNDSVAIWLVSHCDGTRSIDILIEMALQQALEGKITLHDAKDQPLSINAIQQDKNAAAEIIGEHLARLISMGIFIASEPI